MSGKGYLMLWMICGACATSSGSAYREEILGLTDMSLEYIMTQWGEPDYKLPKSNGQSVKYESVMSVDEEPLSGELIKKICVANLDINKEGLVEDWGYSDCKDLNPRPPKPSEAVDEGDFDVDDDRKLPDLPMAPD
ncbi:hypothetical protein [Pseudobacteriovorax antillogorgiicola]|uniref:Uncharacterized protein n=1 Tax=Pseudobacteriovorax antillogorgiicola TaxID=1513793 RepID=A0A1Y6BTS3_9BACT|nr:hypothetical protein [Pseudobacteriovorax antillogorgiicola]TCS52463.1 hypothetical protein EDD56_109208 [Pseudobacteriovorax antillogorgiicola]SMF28427.1 hypothetical protein SAMN06296036_1097 [Pseudobacteriovorax antillogorgiicola]